MLKFKYPIIVQKKMGDSFQSGQGSSKLTRQGLSFTLSGNHYDADGSEYYDPTGKEAVVLAQYAEDGTVTGLYLHGGHSQVVVNESDLVVEDDDNDAVFSVDHGTGNTKHSTRKHESIMVVRCARDVDVDVGVVNEPSFLCKS